MAGCCERYTTYRSLNARVAQPKNCPFGVNSKMGLKNITISDITGTLFSQTDTAIFELNHNIFKKWATFSFCHYCMQ